MSGKRKRSTGGQSAGGEDDEDDADDAASFMASKYRKTIDGAADEFLCPITQELPVEPVTAMDGRVYERKAIEEHLRTGNGRSPMTNQPMGSTLLPAPHVRNSLELMVKSGALTGDKVDAWKSKLQEEETIAKLLEKAQAGDTDAMTHLGFEYELQTKYTDAFAWYQRAAAAGNIHALGLVGRFKIRGVGTSEKEPALGLMMMTEAASNGSMFACLKLGKFFQRGLTQEGAYADRAGLPPGGVPVYLLKKDEAQAAKWYRKLPECADLPGLPIKETRKNKVFDWLRRYDEAQAAAAGGGAAAE